MWPTFIGIGPGRAGTTTVYHALKEHPQICLARDTKETNFFNQQYDQGHEWYQQFFAGCDADQARGEISNTYFYDERVPGRIAQHVPDILLFTTLRNPFARVVSAYLYQKSAGEIEADLSFATAIARHPHFLQQNCYADILHRFLACFPREQLLIAFFDDLQANPQGYICRLYEFIGVDSDFRSQAIYSTYNEMVEARSRLLTLLAHRLARWLRRRQWYAWLNRAKEASWLRGFFYRQIPLPAVQMGSEEWEICATHFVPQIQAVEQLTGRDLSHWYAR